MPDKPPQLEKAQHSKVFVLLAFGVVGYLALILAVFIAEQRIGYENSIVYDHFAVIVGLPMVAVLSLAIVLLLPQTYGRIEFKALGIRFKGAAGPVVLWLLCFLSISAVIKLLW